jgi:membrane protease subunit (stomatin/prohibitin family)
MGLVDKLRAELIDIIEWVDDSRHTLVWRFPRYHNQIKHGARLIVRPGQEAVFVHRGQIADVFEPGTYRLATHNLPILSTIQGWKHGFDSPFKAEVYFVGTRQITDLKWGTPNPVMMRDPDFGPIRIRAFGTYTIKACDPPALLQELVGTDSSFEADEISELLRSIVNSAFADVVAASEIAALDLARNYGELSEAVRQAVVSRIDDEYGLDVPQLYIVNISFPPEVEKALDTRTSMNVIGDMGLFQQYQLGQAMPIAAASPAGGLAGAGVGVGMGLAAAHQLSGLQSPSSSVASGAAPPPAPTAAWHVAENGQTFGPFSMAQLAEAVTRGRVTRETLVWTAGRAGWSPAAQVPELGHLFPPPPPPPAPPVSGS